MKISYELKNGKGFVTLEVGGKTFQETWHDEDGGFTETEGAAIDTLIERMSGVSEVEYPFCLEEMSDLPCGGDVFDTMAKLESDLDDLVNGRFE